MWWGVGLSFPLVPAALRPGAARMLSPPAAVAGLSPFGKHARSPAPPPPSTCLTPHFAGQMGQKKKNGSSMLAWEIPWTEEPDRLQSMGLMLGGIGGRRRRG